ncbi:MAG: hypothetical protein OCD01_15320 [Fibrobacterales bacterium]
MIHTTFLLLLFTVSFTFATSNHFNCDVSTGLAGSSTLTDSLSHALSNNPAIRVASQTIALEISTCSPYSVPGLTHTQGGIALSLYEISIALHMAKIESAHLYSQTRYGLTLAHTFGGWATFGLQSILFSEQFPGARYVTGTLKMGMVATPFTYATLGISLTNIASIASPIRQPVLISIGATYEVTSQIKLSTAIREGENGNWRKEYGFSWNLFPALTLQMGFSSQPFTWSLGMVINLFKQRPFYNRSIHPELGSTNTYGIKSVVDLQK